MHGKLLDFFWIILGGELMPLVEFSPSQADMQVLSVPVSRCTDLVSGAGPHRLHVSPAVDVLADSMRGVAD